MRKEDGRCDPIFTRDFDVESTYKIDVVPMVDYKKTLENGKNSFINKANQTDYLLLFNDISTRFVN